jgi:hypothetical protein
MPASKATPKAEITLLSKDDAGWKFAHSPSGLADFSLKQKLGQKFTAGIGFTVSKSGLGGCSSCAACDHNCWRQQQDHVCSGGGR